MIGLRGVFRSLKRKQLFVPEWSSVGSLPGLLLQQQQLTSLRGFAKSPRHLSDLLVIHPRKRPKHHLREALQLAQSLTGGTGCGEVFGVQRSPRIDHAPVRLAYYSHAIHSARKPLQARPASTSWRGAPSASTPAPLPSSIRARCRRWGSTC